MNYFKLESLIQDGRSWTLYTGENTLNWKILCLYFRKAKEPRSKCKLTTIIMIAPEPTINYKWTINKSQEQRTETYSKIIYKFILKWSSLNLHIDWILIARKHYWMEVYYSLNVQMIKFIQNKHWRSTFFKLVNLI